MYVLIYITQIEKLKRWCISRQESGFQGRPNKSVDTCYSFWIGGTLKLLNSLHLVDFVENKKYIMSTQDSLIGGFSKWPNTVGDPLHTYLGKINGNISKWVIIKKINGKFFSGLCGLSLMNEYDLRPIEPALNISWRAHQHLKKLHSMWDS